MIINVRGTHGAGKTMLVRQIKAQYSKQTPLFVEGRQNPIGYVCKHRDCPPLFILGSYVDGVASGGCDTIKYVDDMFRWIRRYAKKQYHVLFEGIVAQHSTPRIKDLHDRGYRVRVIAMLIPPRRAIRSVERRRRRAGNMTPLDPTNLRHEIQSVISTSARLDEHGISVTYVKTRRAARARVQRLLGL